jgi:hypothetical protein
MFRSCANIVSQAHLKYQESYESTVLEMNVERQSKYTSGSQSGLYHHMGDEII